MQEFLPFLFHLDAGSGCTLGGRTCVLRCAVSLHRSHSPLPIIWDAKNIFHPWAAVVGSVGPAPSNSSPGPTMVILCFCASFWPVSSWKKPTFDAPGKNSSPPEQLLGGRQTPRNSLLGRTMADQKLDWVPTHWGSPPLMEFFRWFSLKFSLSYFKLQPTQAVHHL